jgi:hypothetical protein
MSHSNIHMLLDKIIHPGAPIQEIDLQPRLRGIHAPGDFWTDPKKRVGFSPASKLEFIIKNTYK